MLRAHGPFTALASSTSQTFLSLLVCCFSPVQLPPLLQAPFLPPSLPLLPLLWSLTSTSAAGGCGVPTAHFPAEIFPSEALCKTRQGFPHPLEASGKDAAAFKRVLRGCWRRRRRGSGGGRGRGGRKHGGGPPPSAPPVVLATVEPINDSCTLKHSLPLVGAEERAAFRQGKGWRLTQSLG